MLQDHWSSGFSITFIVPTHGCSSCNLAMICQPVLENILFETNGHMHVYSPRQGQETQWGLNFHFKVTDNLVPEKKQRHVLPYMGVAKNVLYKLGLQCVVSPYLEAMFNYSSN